MDQKASYHPEEFSERSPYCMLAVSHKRAASTLISQRFQIGIKVITDLSQDADKSNKDIKLGLIRFLGVRVDADMEEIKAAYRRLSKEYHPDTTSLPLKAASDKFMKLREIYDVLMNNEETRRFYDWKLSQEAASRQAEKMRMKLEDPYEKEVRSYKPRPDPVDPFGGTYVELSDQTLTALSFDIFVIIFAICCFVYVLVFKAPDY